MDRVQAMEKIIEWLTRYGMADECKICDYDKGGVMCCRNEDSCLNGMIRYFQKKHPDDVGKTAKTGK